MLRALVVAGAMVFASPVLADQCKPSSTLLPQLELLSAKHATYDGDAVRRAVKIYAAMPPAGPEPQADRLVVAEMRDGSTLLVFVDGGNVCATMSIPDTRAAAMAKAFILGTEV